MIVARIEEESLKQVAAYLAACGEGETVALRVPDQPCCPHLAVPFAALMDYHRRRGVNVQLVTPDGGEPARVWAGVVAGRLSPPEMGVDVAPFGRVWRFSSSEEQGWLVNAFTLQLGKSATLGKGVKEAFIWCVNEVTDNVLVHSARPGETAYGYVMVHHNAVTHRLKVCVLDLGIGLKASFAGSAYAPKDDAEAIALALKANVTSGIGQGNGLWGMHELIRRADRGRVSLVSGEAAYLFAPAEGVDGASTPRVLAGFEAGTTQVDFRLCTDGGIRFAEVFGAGYAPVDLWQEARERDDGALVLTILELAGGSGTRPSAAGIRHLAENALDNDGLRVILDFKDVTFCSSAFVDELIGKLLLKYGMATYIQRIQLSNVTGLTAQLIAHALTQRMAEIAKGEKL